ncbi:MAG: RNA methyltransferase [Bacteroidota bacterium]
MKVVYFAANFMNIISVQSLDHPSLLPYRTMRQPVEHWRQGIFIAEGERVVRRLVESTTEIISFLLSQEWWEIYQPLLLQRAQQPNKIFIADNSLLEAIVGFRLHQGIMAIAKIPPMQTREENFSSHSLFVALDGIANAENMGVIVRNCSAFGVESIIVGETSCSPYLRRAVRNSMGAIYTMNIFHSENLVNDLHFLRDNGTSIIAAHPQPFAKEIQNEIFGEKLCIVFGSEGNGISQPVLDVCTQIVQIPMQNNTDSLNVASATAVMLWEIVRRNLLQ